MVFTGRRGVKWFDEGAIGAWNESATGLPGGRRPSSDLPVVNAWTLRSAFTLPPRADRLDPGIKSPYGGELDPGAVPRVWPCAQRKSVAHFR